MNELEKINETIFENIKHVDDDGNEYWYARELQKILQYNKWENFEKVIVKAIIACKTSNYSVSDHFPDVRKMVSIGSKTKRELNDYKLSRYACYLIAQNGDSRKKVIALAQTYFAIQTRKHELLEQEYNNLTEDEKRFYQRDLTKKGNYSLNQTAKNAGVKNFDKFHNAGYKGLYNGETANDIAKRKGLRYREDILDNMGSEGLAANLFRITQTDAKLKKDRITGEGNANDVHFNIGKNIREVIAKNGGTMPEDLPIPNKSLKELENINETIFESIKHVDEDDNEYWYARELQKVLEYTQWRKFNGVIEKAMNTCKASNYKVSDHFAGAGKMVDIGSNTLRNIKDYKLSRYACYLIAQNGDSRKNV